MNTLEYIEPDDWDTGPLNKLIRKAELSGQWLQSRYQGIWFSPSELRAANRAGKFRWGPDNWILRDPQERLGELENLLSENAASVEAFKRRMGR